MTAIPDQLIEIALESASGNDFESFVHGLMAEFSGDSYLPMGGIHDGGADGMYLEFISETKDRPGAFIQTSIERDIESKIRRTVTRLREVGRSVSVLTFVTPHAVSKFDMIEERLTQQMGALVRIRERGFVRTYINQSTRQQDNFRAHLGRYLEYLRHLGSTQIPTKSSHIIDPSVVVFLRQETESEASGRDILEATADALILWALQGTDPDAGIKMTVDSILEQIQKALPNAASFLPRDLVVRRLRSLSSKRDGRRQVNHHRTDDAYVLPFETRRSLEDETIEDEALSLRVRAKFEERAAACDSALNSRTVAETSIAAIQLAFESRGLEFAAFLEGRTAEHAGERSADLREPLHAAVTRFATGGNADALRLAAFETLRGAIYSGDPDEREYLRRLAKTYSIFFMLRQDPAIVRYFADMTQRLRLYIGTDLLVQALSEHYLPKENRTATLMLELASAAGAQLLLAESVLEEVLGNIRVADTEYQNYFAKVERHLTPMMIHEVPKILVRAYLYNLGAPGGPKGWESFVNNFLTYSRLREASAENELRLYLMGRFRMEFIETTALIASGDARDVSALTAKLLPRKYNNYDLAHNDALMVCAIYGDRSVLGEVSQASPFGYSTWWLTTETSVLKEAEDLVGRHQGVAFLMRPEFLLNFFALAPSASAVRESYRSVFPSTLGISLSRRMAPGAVHKLMRELNDAEEMDEARRLAVMSSCVDRLKTDFARRYSVGVQGEVEVDPALG